jgi:hypothetical protein
MLIAKRGKWQFVVKKLSLGALSSRSAPSMLVGVLFKKFGLFLKMRIFWKMRSITESAFQEAYQQWKKRWERCIASRGDYFEGSSA